MPEKQAGAPPSPQLFFETVTAFHQTEALKAAIQLELFTAIAEGNQSAATIARRCQASERGTRILCDALVIMGFLTKKDSSYGLTQDSAIFLDQHSPAYIGGSIRFLLSPPSLEGFRELTAAVRKGGTAIDHNSTKPEHPMWVDFARAMAPMMKMPADLIAKLLKADEGRKVENSRPGRRPRIVRDHTRQTQSQRRGLGGRLAERAGSRSRECRSRGRFRALPHDSRQRF